MTNEGAGEAELRREMVKACRVLYAAKTVGDGLGGHLSTRIGEERILIKPRPVSWWSLAPEDLIVIDFKGARVDRPRDPSGVQEWPIHARYTPPVRRCSASCTPTPRRRP
jgi:ribulose-5-phosphate 4-epimerase/fuculose-1-phosphate aldolase